MCRCCQRCWEDFYWNCFEERFCYDESIANYNPDDDEDYIASQKNGHAISAATQRSNNNHLTVPEPICQQPMRAGHANFNNLKIQDEEFRRETQTNMPMLGPEILAVFANSQIFQDHQPTKLSRINTKQQLPGIHTPSKEASSPSLLATSALAAAAASTAITAAAEQERLIRSLEANLNGDVTDHNKNAATSDVNITPEKRITFTLTSTGTTPTDSVETINSANNKFDTICEELPDVAQKISGSDEVILRPRSVQRHATHLLMQAGTAAGGAKKRSLRHVKSVPYLNVRGNGSDIDIFTITGSTTGSQLSISMTPEVPSISFANLPKNYDDTPTLEKYRVSTSLYAIQTANAARATQDDYSMPRYFRRTAALQAAKSSEILSASSSNSKEEIRRPEKEKSKRLQMLRSNLPPLLIHSVSFSRKRGDESKQLD